MSSDNKFIYTYPSAPFSSTLYAPPPLPPSNSLAYPSYNDYLNQVEVINANATLSHSTSDSVNKITRLAKFDALIRRHEINPDYAIKLRQLEGFEIVIICDDSGSMNTPVTNPSIKDHKNLQSRWDELRSTVKTIVEIAGVLDKTGVDIYFLNRPGVKNVTDFATLEPHFATDPEGYTPIVQVFTQVLNDMKQILSEKKLLIILATDGEPTTSSGLTTSGGISEKTKFYNLLKIRQPIDRIYTTILACTDDDSVISYLQNWDTTIANLDVVDDFHTVKSNVLTKQGQTYHFSFGDYVVKTLLGSMDKFFDEIDEIDETYVSTSHKNGTCSIL